MWCFRPVCHFWPCLALPGTWLACPGPPITPLYRWMEAKGGTTQEAQCGQTQPKYIKMAPILAKIAPILAKVAPILAKIALNLAQIALNLAQIQLSLAQIQLDLAEYS